MKTEILKKNIKKSIKNTGIDPEVDAGLLPKDTVVRTPGHRQTQD